MVTPARSRRQRRLGQNFLADSNLLDAIVGESGLGEGDVALEFGAGGGALSERLAVHAAHLHLVEIDRRLEDELAPLAAQPNVSLHWGDAMKLDLAGLDPAPGIIVSNLPYSVATPLILRTVEELTVRRPMDRDGAARGGGAAARGARQPRLWRAVGAGPVRDRGRADPPRGA